MSTFLFVMLYLLGFGGEASCVNFRSSWSSTSNEGNEENDLGNGTVILSDMLQLEDVLFAVLKENDGHISISFDNSSEYLRSVFNPEGKTKFIVHGWLSSEKAFIVKHTGEEYVKHKGGNIVAVDWSRLASWKLYPMSALNVVSVGGVIGAMVNKLIEAKATSLDKVHLIGHSLGAHIMGIAGTSVKGGKVSRITGLDPAKPGFEHVVYEINRLDPSDAEFVDVIHSAAGAAGYYSPIGHVDFYPNGGTPPQPGCFDLLSDPLKLVGCSHARSYEFYSESIENPKGFMAVKCESWSEFSQGSCSGNTITYMGDDTPSTTRGLYYLTTNAGRPYAKGKRGLKP